MVDTKQESASGGKPAISWVALLERAFFEGFAGTEEGRALYGDPNKGATLDQAWRTAGALTGVDFLCLAVEGRGAPPEHITRVEWFDAAELVAALARAFALVPSAAFQIFVENGRGGHSITLLGTAGDAFDFVDPWPGRSLLAKENNDLGVDATEVATRRWRIRAAELERVITAAFAFPSLWAKMSGLPYAPTYAELSSSELFTFFHLVEVERPEPHSIVLGNRRFARDVAIEIRTAEDDTVTRATLRIRREFIMSPATRPFAPDLTKGFLAAVVPELDRERATPILRAIRVAPVKEAAMKIVAEHPEVAPFLAAYLGVNEPAFVSMSYSTLEMRNSDDWLVVDVTIL